MWSWNAWQEGGWKFDQLHPKKIYRKHLDFAGNNLFMVSCRNFPLNFYVFFVLPTHHADFNKTWWFSTHRVGSATKIDHIYMKGLWKITIFWDTYSPPKKWDSWFCNHLHHFTPSYYNHSKLRSIHRSSPLWNKLWRTDEAFAAVFWSLSSGSGGRCAGRMFTLDLEGFHQWW